MFNINKRDSFASCLKFQYPADKSLKRQLLLLVVNAGFEFFITDSIALDLDVKYIWDDADFDFTDSMGTEIVKIDLNGFGTGISYKYFF